MKRIFAVALCAVAVASIASAFTLIENPVSLNGKPFAKAVTINGKLYISTEDFAKAAGGTLTLEPNFKLQGNTLTALVSSYSSQHKHKTVEPSAALNTIGGVQEKQSEYKDRGGIILQRGLFQVRKAGQISNHVIMNNGKAFVPLADVAKAFGAANWTGPVTLKAGEAINLNFAVNGDGILGFQQ